MVPSTLSSGWMNLLEPFTELKETLTYVYQFIKDTVKDEQASLVAQSVKNLPAVQETQVQSLGGEDPLEKEMATELPGISRGHRSLVRCSPYEALCKKFILGETLVRTNGETASQTWESYLPMIYI